jgi:hypothetical protein
VATAEAYLEMLSTPAAALGRLERAAAGSDDALPDKQELIQRLRAEVAYIEHKTGVEVDHNAVDLLVAQADEGLSRILGDGPDAHLDAETVSGLEAVVRTDGSRPVLFVEDDFVDVGAPSIGAYAAPLSRLEGGVREVCRAVGRVDDPSASAAPLGYQGTAWVVAESLVLTNYHVLQAIAPGGVRRGGTFEGRLNTGAAVHFGHEVGNPLPKRRFPVRRVVAVGREGAQQYLDAGTLLNFDGLDMAVLQLESVAGRPFPQPTRLARGDDPRTRGSLASKGRTVYVVGYPGNEQSTTPDLFAEIFAGVKSYKRLAPGAITDAAWELPTDPRGWVITHDASTLGGNSGSALVDLDADGRTFLGLHFAGLHARRNWAHALERITAELDAALPGVPR